MGSDEKMLRLKFKYSNFEYLNVSKDLTARLEILKGH